MSFLSIIVAIILLILFIFTILQRTLVVNDMFKIISDCLYSSFLKIMLLEKCI